MARTRLRQPEPQGFLSLGEAWRSRMFEASVARSLLGSKEFLQLVHDGGSSTTQLWWGPVVPVRDGDLVHYFKTASGRIAVESVHGPDGMPTLNAIQ